VAAIATPIVLCTPVAGAQSAPNALRNVSKPGLTSYWAFVDRPVVARRLPSGAAGRVGSLHTTTQFGTSQAVEVLAQTPAGGSHAGWTHIRLSQRPNNVTAWVPTAALSRLHARHSWLKVDREHFTATLIRRGKVIFKAPIGVGQPQWPTPSGQFFIEESLSSLDASGLYGPLAFGTSAWSAVLTDWPGGGQVGIHGTNQPQLIPGRISHGCIRMRNADILRLARLLKVGTPLTIS
jgi:hypothetical protein